MVEISRIEGPFDFGEFIVWTNKGKFVKHGFGEWDGIVEDLYCYVVDITTALDKAYDRYIENLMSVEDK